MDSVTIKEAAKMLGIATNTAYSYIYSGRLFRAQRGHVSLASVERLKAELELKRVGKPVPKPKETTPTPVAVTATETPPTVLHCDDCGIIIDCPAPNSTGVGEICLECHKRRKRVRQSLDNSFVAVLQSFQLNQHKKRSRR